MGKTTAVNDLIRGTDAVFFSADAPTPPTADVIVERWQQARKLPSSDRTLVLDEVQKIPGWSEVAKRLWDEDRRNGTRLRVALLGSSALLIEKGLSESLTGRFETNYFSHWLYREVVELADASVDNYTLLGGYPKAYDFGDDTDRARAYIETSILEPTLGRDILALHAVDKPALLRQLFWYVSKLPAHIVSYSKILGHLQDRGNSATIAHYAELLSLAMLVVPIYKFARAPHNTRKSIPKWIVANPAIVDAAVLRTGFAGFVFENIVGAHLINLSYGKPRIELCYWRADNREVDFVVVDHGEPMLAIEVKSGRSKRVATTAAMRKAGLSCPVMIIDRTNIREFLMTTGLDQVIDVINTSQ